MTYEEFMDTEIRDELSVDHYEPELGIVYGTVDNGFNYGGVSYFPGARISYHLDDGTMRYRH